MTTQEVSPSPSLVAIIFPSSRLRPMLASLRRLSLVCIVTTNISGGMMAKRQEGDIGKRAGREAQPLVGEVEGVNLLKLFS